MVAKVHERWRSDRLEQELSLVRWGSWGTPVLVFPTAGGDAEEIEREGMVDACDELLGAGRVKLYSCDSLAGRAMLVGAGSAQHRTWMLNAFHHTIAHEVVPAIRADCGGVPVEVIAAGSSIGAFNALAMLTRFPATFRAAVCMSGTYDLQRFLDGRFDEDLYVSSPLHFLPGLGGPHLDVLRGRFALLASGEGRWEDIGESWRAAQVLGAQGIPNRVDSWGPHWDHQWPTWRRMLPQYLDELA